jgi:hypothetical protein
MLKKDYYSAYQSATSRRMVLGKQNSPLPPFLGERA